MSASVERQFDRWERSISSLATSISKHSAVDSASSQLGSSWQGPSSSRGTSLSASRVASSLALAATLGSQPANNVERLLRVMLSEMRKLREDVHSSEQRQALLFEKANFAQYVSELVRNFGKLRGVPGQASINGTQLQVLTFLLSHAEPGVWPTLLLKDIAFAAGVKERAARGAISALVERGLVKRVSSPGKLTTYDLSGTIDELDRIAGERQLDQLDSKQLELITVRVGVKPDEVRT